MANVIEYKLLDPVLEEEIGALDETERRTYLFLQDHPEYKNYFKIDSFDPFFLRDFSDLIGEYRAISIWKLPLLADRCRELGYELIFLNDPRPFFHWLEELNEPFPYELGFELKPFQQQGFNFAKDRKATIIEWDTGTGKSVYGCARAKYLLLNQKVEKVVVVSKKHNRINWVRQLKLVAGLEAALPGSYWNVEKQKYIETGKNAVEKRVIRTEQYLASDIFIINYEKFRDDEQELTAALSGKRVYFLWDEMPTKLKHSRTGVYKGAKRVTQSCAYSYQDMLSATIVENSPEDVYHCVKILDPTALDSRVMDFRMKYAQSWNAYSPTKVAVWNTTRLHELGMRLSHMTHKASKYKDPEIAAQFPKEHWDPVLIEMSPEDRKLYDAVLSKILSEFWDGAMPVNNILQRMGVLQHICNNPAVLNLAQGDFAWAIRSKNPPTDKHCAKLETFKDDLEVIEGKIVVFSAYNALGAAALTKYLDEWGYNYVFYRNQADEDHFRNDPDCKIFISSDRGSDSLSLEVAQTVINYDLPWKHSTLIQRVNRVNRITSMTKGGANRTGISNVYYRTYLMENTMEERKQIVLERKKAYGVAIGAETDEQMEAISSLTKTDLWFMLTGNWTH